MATFSDDLLAIIFGVLGNVISFLVYLAPLVTFYQIYNRRSTRNYHAVPYSVALFSAMLMLYYAHLKGKAYMLITINTFGCGIEAAYLIVFFTFANTRVRLQTARLFLVFNTGAYILLIFLTSMVSRPHRLKVVGWICATFSVCVYAAPLSIMRRVIKTKSVEFMPFPLSFCLTLSAIVWLFYGIFTHDYFVATPNILGLLLGAAQIILYFIYRNGPRREEAPSQMRNMMITANETTLVRDLFMVAEEILEYVDNGRNQTDNSADNDGDEEATTLEPPQLDELQINGVTGNNTMVHDQMHLKEEQEIVEIPEQMTVPENSTIKDVDQGAPLEPNVDMV